MNLNPNHDLNELLAAFGAEILGEGDPVAGACALGACACTIANIACPGSGFVDGDESRVEVGTSLLVTGPHVSSLVRDNVLDLLIAAQNNLASHAYR
jgi:hypothetical protein